MDAVDAADSSALFVLVCAISFVATKLPLGACRLAVAAVADMALALTPASPSYACPKFGEALAALNTPDFHGMTLGYWVKLVTTPEYDSRPGISRHLLQESGEMPGGVRGLHDHQHELGHAFVPLGAGTAGG
jgi:hypothetical protein